MRIYGTILVILLSIAAKAQSDQHYTMFMYNKLAYNPAYAGSRDQLSVNGIYRNQWTGIEGAPTTINISGDAPVGSYMKPERKIAVGLSLIKEMQGVERNTIIRGYYAYRVFLRKSVLSFGLSGSGDFYSANYDQLDLYHQADPNFVRNVSNAFLPNFGAGVFWSGDNFYVGASSPNMLENYVDKQQVIRRARQIRTFYVMGGRTFLLNDQVSLLPQALVRYSGNANYGLPLNVDLNISAIFLDRLLFGLTYRTDKSLEAITHIQVLNCISLGYAFDYTMSDLNGVSGGTHEVILGYNMVRDSKKFINPRFIKRF